MSLELVRPVDRVSSAERTDPLERLEMLCDPGSLEVIRSAVASPRTVASGRRPVRGDGVVAAMGRVARRPVCCYAQDQSFMGGSLGEAHAESIVAAMRLAGRARVPLVAFNESAGARLQEGLAALDGYARIFRANVELSGRVPQISVVTGTSAGGGCYSPALTDFVVLTRSASMFLTGPDVVREAVGEDVTPDGLGGPAIHERNGVCHFVAGDAREAVALVRALLSFLPQHSGGRPPLVPAAGPNAAFTDPGAIVPDEARRVYDMRALVRALADGSNLLEVAPKWAPNLITALARVDGHAVGVVANQPRRLGGVLDYESGQKGARFVRTCNTYGLPLLVLVDTPGFMPGTRQESAGVIRHGAKLLHAFAEATVPRISVIVRKAYGGAYITMNSRGLGADLSLAWPGATIGVMAAEAAVGIVNRRQLEAACDAEAARERLAAAYAEEHLTADVAAAGGFVDEVIEPSETRARIASALAVLADPERRIPNAGNIPL